jgi:hypothetical protein
VTWLALASAIAVGIAVGREASRWIGALTHPSRKNLQQCAAGDRPWSALFVRVPYWPPSHLGNLFRGLPQEKAYRETA